MLQKAGWKEGEGLGSNEDGIKNPINQLVGGRGRAFWGVLSWVIIIRKFCLNFSLLSGPNTNVLDPIGSPGLTTCFTVTCVIGVMSPWIRVASVWLNLMILKKETMSLTYLGREWCWPIAFVLIHLWVIAMYLYYISYNSLLLSEQPQETILLEEGNTLHVT